jgi:hypothetical protein
MAQPLGVQWLPPGQGALLVTAKPLALQVCRAAPTHQVLPAVQIGVLHWALSQTPPLAPQSMLVSTVRPLLLHTIALPSWQPGPGWQTQGVQLVTPALVVQVVCGGQLMGVVQPSPTALQLATWLASHWLSPCWQTSSTHWPVPPTAVGAQW